MNIYLAGSFKEVANSRKLAVKLRTDGHKVFCFCDEVVT